VAISDSGESHLSRLWRHLAIQRPEQFPQEFALRTCGGYAKRFELSFGASRTKLPLIGRLQKLGPTESALKLMGEFASY
jgi:hypothetical protein